MVLAAVGKTFMPDMHFSAVGMTVATLAIFFLGFLWYTPLFGKAWAKELGIEPDPSKITKGFMIKALLLNLIGNFLLVFVLDHNIQAWNAQSWGYEEGFVPAAMAATMSAVFTWLGFFLPQDLNKTTWQMKSWKLFFIDTTYHLLSLLVVSFILVFVK